MSDRLSLSQVAALTAYAATTAGGQLLFKTPALRGLAMVAERITGLLLNGYFLVSLILYAALTVLWVWILSFTQLSRLHRADFVWAFLHCGMIDGIAGAASMGCHRCLQ